MIKTAINLEEELVKSREAIKRLEQESIGLRKAIWDMLNYANMYVILLDSRMIIRLINWSLATDLGFEHEHDAIGKCWLEFIPDTSRDLIKHIHADLAFGNNKSKHREITNEVIYKNWKDIISKMV
jgi:hypothetical protein